MDMQLYILENLLLILLFQFLRLLDMKQKQANVWEAWVAREANEVASSQSRAVLIFTIFTIIFVSSIRFKVKEKLS